MQYKKCTRCELNYVKIEEQFCPVCIRQLCFQDKDEEDSLYDGLCPFCMKTKLQEGQEICKTCKKNTNLD